MEQATQTIPAGYKQTEIGVIPTDWDVNLIEQFGSVIDGDRGHNYPSSNDFRSDGYCLFLSASNVTKTGFKFDECQFISKEKEESLSKGKLKKGDVVLTTRGTVGNVAYYKDSIPYNHLRINSGMVLIRAENKSKITQDFLYALCRSYILANQIDRLSFGSAQPQLTVNGISSFQFPLPPTTAEQTAIATALSDTDALIEKLEKLIAKKKAIKQGAMQQLLTGKKRLPGFSGEWKVKKLREIADIKTGGKNNQDKSEDGLYSFFVRSQIVEKIKSYSYDCEAILVPGEGNIGNIFHYILGKFDVHQRVYAITNFNKEISGKFIFYYMKKYFGEHAMRNTVKATVDSLRLPTFENFSMYIPSTKEEQTAIATVLSDMDAEIEKLENKLEKYRQIKTGMMQQLLTGKIRLVKN